MYLSAEEPPLNDGLDARVRLLDGLDGYPEKGAPFGPGQAFPELQDCPWASPTEGANPVYSAVRELLHGMGLDAARYGSPQWNPLADLVDPGGRVTVKPNMVRHYNGNPAGSWISVPTHWSVVRPLVDYALKAVGPAGRVRVGDASHWDNHMEVLLELLGVPTVLAHYARTAAGRVSFADFRREYFEQAGPVKTRRHALPGDPEGYVDVDLGEHSSFHDPQLDPRRFFASEYDNRGTVRAHTGGRHAYLISGTCLKSELFINVPKLKTHHLLGITVAMKNLVGINGDKNLLPHFRAGFVDQGGDQYPRRTPSLVARRAVLRAVQPVLVRSEALTRLWGTALGAFHRAGGRNPYAGGSWIGNDTVWRMTLDLNRILLHAGEDGRVRPGIRPRRYLTVVDGIIAGEDDGPMRPLDRAAGVLLAAGNPLLCDLAAAHVMGFDPMRLTLIREGWKPHPLPLSPVRDEAAIDAARWDAHRAWVETPLAAFPSLDFVPPLGWREIARDARAAAGR